MLTIIIFLEVVEKETSDFLCLFNRNFLCPTLEEPAVQSTFLFQKKIFITVKLDISKG